MLGGAVIAGTLTWATAGARTLEVEPGESIQAAVRDARHGDVISIRPGVYRQSVEIRKNRITLRGAGARQSGTVLKPPARTKRCDGGESGVCILPSDDRHGNRTPTAGVRVSRLLIRGFEEYGAVAEFARHAELRKNAFVGNGEYGAAAFHSRRTAMIRNRASESGEAGFYIGDSPHAKAVLHDNHAARNGFGFYVRDASGGTAIENVATGNCIGMMLRDSISSGRVARWTVARGEFSRNSRHCGGTGIMLAGARRSVIRRNDVIANRQPDPLRLSGGIVLASTAALGGSDTAHNLIAHNRALRNRSADIAWDRDGHGNRFRANRCNRSRPRGICHARGAPS